MATTIIVKLAMAFALLLCVGGFGHAAEITTFAMVDTRAVYRQRSREGTVHNMIQVLALSIVLALLSLATVAPGVNAQDISADHYFKWFHVFGHEINRRGQIRWLRSRTTNGSQPRRPSNKSLDASGGEVITDFQLSIADLIRAAASTQRFDQTTKSFMFPV